MLSPIAINDNGKTAILLIVRVQVVVTDFKGWRRFLKPRLPLTPDFTHLWNPYAQSSSVAQLIEQNLGD